MVAPEGWEWTSEWNVDTNRAVDEDGNKIIDKQKCDLFCHFLGKAKLSDFARRGPITIEFSVAHW